MGSGRQLLRAEQLELAPVRHTSFKIVVYRAAPEGAEVLLRRAGQAWSLPTGACRLAESPQDGAGRYLREGWGLDLAVVELDGGDRAEAMFAAEAEAADSGMFVPLRAGEGWFGVGKVRALALGADGVLIEHVMGALE
jgi:hypothetical protein